MGAPGTAADGRGDATTNAQATPEPPPRPSLSHRAPIEPFASRVSITRYRRGSRSAEISLTVQQQNQCIRSRTRLVSHSLGFGKNDNGGTHSAQDSGFPYPDRFRHMVQGRSNMDEENPVDSRGADHIAWRLSDMARHLGVDDLRLPSIHRSPNPFHDTDNPPRPWIRRLKRPVEPRLTVKREVRWYTSWSGRGMPSGVAVQAEETLGRTVELTVQPIYVVLGIFPRGQAHPIETVLFLTKPQQLFWRLRWAVFRLRGWRETFLSLRHVTAVGLYQCNAASGTHRRVELDDNGLADMQQFLHTYRRWTVHSEIAHAWAAWIHQTLNNSSHRVELQEGCSCDDYYSLEFVLGWSVARITAVILLPVLLSLAVGIWLNSQGWTDLATIQTAWGTASYIVTAGGLMAALLAIASSLVDK